eukprot:TRINITY_DN46289_c0_g1_i1.p1 TRINITY_DN46289_c0_g1~~TRINITY_DN46289_c0_g1_i1.p1  ORF type:complete len:317 (-),score=44.02 TRINITY_DN46289_c0_g1_i1:137-1087(-)
MTKQPRGLRVLLTNDDGPPAPKSRYIEPFHRALRSRGFDVHVCIPGDHRSFSAKAMDPWRTVSVREEQLSDGPAWWLCDGATPAGSANIGLHHGPGPFDLVLSGPNFGANSSSSFLLCSGTLGAALEGALAGVPAIAISFDNDMQEAYKGDAGAGSPEDVAAACELTLDLIERLYQDWPSSVEVFNVNVPLKAGRHAPLIQTCVETRTRYHSLFQREDEQYRFSVSKVTRGEDRPVKRHFVYPTDASVLKSGKVTVTPLKATFAESECDLSSILGGTPKKLLDTGSIPRHPGWILPFVLGCCAGVGAMALARSRRC